MGKIVVAEFLSLDGVMESPGWTVPYWGDDIALFKGSETVDTDALLLGRVTYQGFAAAWPESKDEGAAFFNSVKKYVVSSTLTDLTWNNSQLLTGDLVPAIANLKETAGNVLVYGSCTLVQTLIEHKLADEYNLLVYPVVVGSGKKLFQDGLNAKFALMETQAFASGVTLLKYKPA